MPTSGQTWPPVPKSATDRLDAVVQDLAAKANTADVYTKSAVDNKIAKKLAPFDATATYAAGDSAIFQNDIYTAKAAITPPTAVTYIGRTFDATGSTITLPSGSAAGDLAILTHSNRDTEAPATPSGWTLISGFPKYSSGRAGIHAYSRVLTAADITAGTLSKAATQGDIRVYRNAGAPTLQAFSGSSTPPGFSVPTGALVLRTFAYGWYTGNETSSSPSIATNVADVGAYYAPGYSRGVVSAHLTGRPVANTDGVGSKPGGGDTLPVSADILIPLTTTINLSQWDKRTDNYTKAQIDTLVANINPFPVLHRWKFDETSGTALADSGNAPMTAYGGAALNVETVGAGNSKAISLDGTDDYLATALSSAGVDDIKGYGYILSFWYKPVSLTVSDCVIAAHGDGAGPVSKGWMLLMGSTSVASLTVYGVGSKMTVNNGSLGLSTTAYRRVSFYIPPAGVQGIPRLYGNGVVAGSGDSNTVIAAAAGPLTFGAYWQSTGAPQLWRAGRYADPRITKVPDPTACDWVAKNDYDRAIAGLA